MSSTREKNSETRWSALLRQLRLDRPIRMFRTGNVDPLFGPDELLYLRFERFTYTEDSRRPDIAAILAASLRFPRGSVNRAKYSEQNDVLFPSWTTWGVISFLAASIPPEIS